MEFKKNIDPPPHKKKSIRRVVQHRSISAGHCHRREEPARARYGGVRLPDPPGPRDRHGSRPPRERGHERDQRLQTSSRGRHQQGRGRQDHAGEDRVWLMATIAAGGSTLADVFAVWVVRDFETCFLDIFECLFFYGRHPVKCTALTITRMHIHTLYFTIYFGQNI